MFEFRKSFGGTFSHKFRDNSPNDKMMRRFLRIYADGIDYFVIFVDI